MNRLTIRYEDGTLDTAKYIDVRFFDRESKLKGNEIIERLASYEDLGLTPDQIREVYRLYADKCKKVAELQKQLENSVKLPCADNGKIII